MRKAGAPFGLKAESDAVADANAEGGRRMVFGNNDGQAVGELLHAGRSFPLLGGKALRGEEERERAEKDCAGEESWMAQHDLRFETNCFAQGKRKVEYIAALAQCLFGID